MPKTNTDIRSVRKYIAENINFEKQNQETKKKHNKNILKRKQNKKYNQNGK